MCFRFQKIHSVVIKSAVFLAFGLGAISISAQTPPVQNPAPPATNPAQPTTVPAQPVTPSSPDGTTQRTNGNVAPANNGVPQTPAQNVGSSNGVPPTDLPTDPPPVAPNFEAPIRPLPSAERVGVDMMNQLSLSLDEAIKLALQNNNDIDSSKITVKIAEFNLKAARGVYDPQINAEPYYESRTTPTASTIGGAGSSGKLTQKSFAANVGASGFSPFAGGSYESNFTSKLPA
jgi:hypothetical protein